MKDNFSEVEGFDKILTKYRTKVILDLCRRYGSMGSALDLGCGIGIITKELSKVFKRVVAIDGSAKKIEIARSSVQSENVGFYNELFEDFEPNDKFNVIVMANVLEHVDNPVMLLKRVREWLDPVDGIVIATVPNGQGFHRKLGMRMGIIKGLYELSEREVRIGHKRVYDKQSLIGDFQEARFRIFESGGVFLKPLSHKQMEKWAKCFGTKTLDGLFEMRKELPDYCSPLYICAGRH